MVKTSVSACVSLVVFQKNISLRLSYLPVPSVQCPDCAESTAVGHAVGSVAEGALCAPAALLGAVE